MVKQKVVAEPYVLEPIAYFDARRGFVRCKPPGVGVKNHFAACADLWRGPNDHVVARFASLGYRSSFQITKPSGRRVDDLDIDDLCAYLADVLVLWLSEGVDDEPTTKGVSRAT